MTNTEARQRHENEHLKSHIAPLNIYLKPLNKILEYGIKQCISVYIKHTVGHSHICQLWVISGLDTCCSTKTKKQKLQCNPRNYQRKKYMIISTATEK